MLFGAGCARPVAVTPVQPTPVPVEERKSQPPANEPKGTTQQDIPKSPVASVGVYKEYSSEMLKAEQDRGQKIVLFFYAPWCPYCRAADAAFRSNTDSIPSGVTVLKIDYDSNGALKDRYGVTIQHTFVQIDANGNLVTKWVSGDIMNLKKNVQ